MAIANTGTVIEKLGHSYCYGYKNGYVYSESQFSNFSIKNDSIYFKKIKNKIT